jgi:hypothetical protein
MRLDGVHHLGVNVRNLDEAEKLNIDTLGFRLMGRCRPEASHNAP